MNLATKTLAASLCAAAFSFAAPTALAASVSLTFTGFQDYGTPGAPGNRVKVTDSVKPSNNYGWKGGAFAATAAPGGDASFLSSVYKVGSNIITWCVELSQKIGFNSGPYTYTLEGPSGNTWFTNIEKLFNQFMGEAQTNITSTAMQLAVWEVTHEANASRNSGYSLSTGTFKANPLGTSSNPGTNVAAFNKAQEWLGNLNNNTLAADAGYKVIRLKNDRAQDQVAFVQVSEVPIPGAALLFLSALGLGGLARRKQAVQG